MRRLLNSIFFIIFVGGGILFALSYFGGVEVSFKNALIIMGCAVIGDVVRLFLSRSSKHQFPSK
jgi:hypothetical protein